MRSAIMTSKFKFPKGRITVSFASANLSKSGGRYDLSIAIGLLLASEQIEPNINSFEFYGELGLDGLTSSNQRIIASHHCKQPSQAKHCMSLPD
ncbi:hypothetical protein HUE58_04990 [Candidatus Ruthia endofausta]|uniref:ATP-binding protein n=1 Tax=Candidatus Ruthia endofausta TaxID=2738852 RepID=A0A6N0HQ52_9GAMM|nr:magnesium chelatase domain-containing protein [Candidatus Ruthia endofausta]QKQ24473.1 hypothetical protein HUE58_04990 [Candidatus Ruthia endofausta]